MNLADLVYLGVLGGSEGSGKRVNGLANPKEYPSIAEIVNQSNKLYEKRRMN